MLSYTDPNDWYTPSQTKEQTFMPPFPSMLAQSHIIYASLIQAKSKNITPKKRKEKPEQSTIVKAKSNYCTWLTISFALPKLSTICKHSLRLRTV
jgi:hypothetical protein